MDIFFMSALSKQLQINLLFLEPIFLTYKMVLIEIIDKCMT